MTISMFTSAPPAALDLISSIETDLDDLNASDLTGLDESDLRALLHSVERVARKAVVASHATISECNDRGSYTRWGYKRLSQMIIGELKVSAGEAARRMRVAAATVALRSMGGEVQEPAHPDLSQAVYDGDLSEQHADEILKVLEKIPAAVTPDKRARAESTMTDVAKNLTPRQIEQVGDRLLAHLDPDGTITDDGDRAKRRGLSLSPQDASLMSKLKGELDPATRAMFEVLFDAWAKPGMNNPDDPDSPSGSASDPDIDRDAADAAAQRDTRTAPQRRHDALSAMAASFIASGGLGSHSGSPAQVVVTMTHQQLLEMSGVATTMSGTAVPIADALDMAKANSMLLAILDAHEMPMFLGRTKRLASAAQRIALWLGARGCTFPGCSTPATWTQAHHVTDWAKGGLTNIDEMTPACTDHHPMVGDGPEQWQTEIVRHGPFKGRCAWIPPASIDPERRPRINHTHHPEELLAQAWERVAERDHPRSRSRNRPPPDDPWIKHADTDTGATHTTATDPGHQPEPTGPETIRDDPWAGAPTWPILDPTDLDPYADDDDDADADDRLQPVGILDDPWDT